MANETTMTETYGPLKTTTGDAVGKKKRRRKLKQGPLRALVYQNKRQ